MFPIVIGGWSVRRALFLVAAPLLAVIPVVALTAGPAQAHDVLLRTEPADGAVLAAPPAQIRLVFEEQALRLGTGVRVTGPDGAVIATDPVQVVGSIVTQPLPTALPAGRYGVVWRVTSADGHPVSGRFAFTASGASASGSSASGASSSGASSSGASPGASPGASSSGVVAAPSAGSGSTPGTSSSVSVSGLVGIVAAALAVAAVAVLGLMAASRRRPPPAAAAPSEPSGAPSEPPGPGSPDPSQN